MQLLNNLWHIGHTIDYTVHASTAEIHITMHVQKIHTQTHTRLALAHLRNHQGNQQRGESWDIITHNFIPTALSIISTARDTLVWTKQQKHKQTAAFPAPPGLASPAPQRHHRSEERSHTGESCSLIQFLRHDIMWGFAAVLTDRAKHADISHSATSLQPLLCISNSLCGETLKQDRLNIETRQVLHSSAINPGPGLVHCKPPNLAQVRIKGAKTITSWDRREMKHFREHAFWSSQIHTLPHRLAWPAKLTEQRH